MYTVGVKVVGGDILRCTLVVVKGLTRRLQLELETKGRQAKRKTKKL